jgi:hypothetical protein
MPELTEAFGKVVRDGVQGALQGAREDRINYLKYLAERSKAAGPADAYQELAALTDRGLVDSEDVQLETFGIQAEYVHSFQQTTGAKGELSVAVGPARLSAGGSLERQEGSSTNLRLTATYRTRPRSEFLRETLESLPPRASAQPAPAGSGS